MKQSAVVVTLVLESAFILFCICMTFPLDVNEPTPSEWMIPSFLIVVALLTFGLLVFTRLDRDVAIQSRQN